MSPQLFLLWVTRCFLFLLLYDWPLQSGQTSLFLCFLLSMSKYTFKLFCIWISIWKGFEVLAWQTANWQWLLSMGFWCKVLLMLWQWSQTEKKWSDLYIGKPRKVIKKLLLEEILETIWWVNEYIYERGQAFPRPIWGSSSKEEEGQQIAWHLQSNSFPVQYIVYLFEPLLAWQGWIISSHINSYLFWCGKMKQSGTLYKVFVCSYVREDKFMHQRTSLNQTAIHLFDWLKIKLFKQILILCGRLWVPYIGTQNVGLCIKQFTPLGLKQLVSQCTSSGAGLWYQCPFGQKNMKSVNHWLTNAWGILKHFVLPFALSSRLWVIVWAELRSRGEQKMPYQMDAAPWLYKWDMIGSDGNRYLQVEYDKEQRKVF